jgi:hypothetical protein
MLKQKSKPLGLTFLVLSVSMMMGGCKSPDPNKANVNSIEARDSQIDLSSFGKDALVKAPVVVDCTLTNGEASKCAQIVVKHKPDNLKVGLFVRRH